MKMRRIRHLKQFGLPAASLAWPECCWRSAARTSSWHQNAVTLLEGQGREPAHPPRRPARRPPISRCCPNWTSFFDDLHFDEMLRQNKIEKWLYLLALTAGAAAIGRLLAFMLERLRVRLEKRGWHAQAEMFAGMGSPLNLVVFTLGLSIGLAQLSMSDALKALNARLLLFLYAISGFWYAFNLVAALEVAIKRLSTHTETQLGDDVVPVIRKLLRAIIVVIGALFILQNVFGRDIGAWLTGLGIAGLAVSLAAQDSLKNLFGSLTILFDRPFMRGHRIKFRRFDSTVEDIGFRSTKIRTSDGSLVTIPNSNIVNDPVDNWALRPRIGRTMNLRLSYNTPVEKVKQAVDIIRKLLESEEFHSPVHSQGATGTRGVDPPQVFFNDFNPDSLNIQINYWYRPASDAWGYLVYSEKFNLRLMEELAKAKIPALTVPAQTTPPGKCPHNPKPLTQSVMVRRG